MILPIFGIFSEIVATFSQKTLFGYISLIWATIVITVLSFIVWLHHFFTMGSGPYVNSFFSITTMIIAIPTGVKIFNWLFTMYCGRIKLYSPMLWTIGFLITFSIGGLSGVLLSIPPIDFIFHNSLFLVAHFHNVIIGGVVFGCFAGITYWFPKIFGFKLNEQWGIYSFWLWIIGFFVAFMPLYILGCMGMTRRISQNIDYKYHYLLIIAAFGVFIIFLGVLSQIIQLYISIKNRKSNHYIDNTGDPWNGRTLEWSISSPPPIYNFSLHPIVKERDSFWKEKNFRKEKITDIVYHDIYIPHNSYFGVLIGFFSVFFGFSMVWHIWWLSLLSIFFVFLLIIKYSCALDNHSVITKDTIIENEKIFFLNKCKKVKYD